MASVRFTLLCCAVFLLLSCHIGQACWPGLLEQLFPAAEDETRPTKRPGSGAGGGSPGTGGGSPGTGGRPTGGGSPGTGGGSPGTGGRPTGGGSPGTGGRPTGGGSPGTGGRPN
ncbi:uncharacterized protein LOC144872202 [Branchiostoma floridae x Branchiostoma japonicum]